MSDQGEKLPIDMVALLSDPAAIQQRLDNMVIEEKLLRIALRHARQQARNTRRRQRIEAEAAKYTA